MKLWLTLYALSDGIIEAEGEVTHGVAALCKPQVAYVQKPHWHTTYTEAVARAREMAVAKIASLERQLAKVKELEAKWADELKGGVQ